MYGLGRRELEEPTTCRSGHTLITSTYDRWLLTVIYADVAGSVAGVDASPGTATSARQRRLPLGRRMIRLC
jgi:hypothetical protein